MKSQFYVTNGKTHKIFLYKQLAVNYILKELKDETEDSRIKLDNELAIDDYIIIHAENNKIVTCDLNGGLGHQFFQILVTIAFSIEHGRDYLFSENLSGEKYHETMFKHLKRNILEEFDRTGFLYIKETSFLYSKLPVINTNCILSGSFCSFKYFNTYYEDIYKIMKISLLKDSVKRKCNFDEELLHVSIHFRPENLKIEPLKCFTLPFMYYVNCINRLLEDKQDGKDICVHCFYADQDKAIVNIFINKLSKMFENIKFMNKNESLEDWEDMLAMSICDHNIIANSMFSYMAAYLNNNKDKLVYCPKIWFEQKDESEQLKDLVPPSWNIVYTNHYLPFEVLNFWFGYDNWNDTNLNHTKVIEKYPLWFGVIPQNNFKSLTALDRMRIDFSCKRYDSLMVLASSDLAIDAIGVEWYNNDLETMFAKLILFDQISRNCHRGTKDAFEYDDNAIDIAKTIVNKRLHEDMNVIQILFLGVVFQHSEDIEDFKVLRILTDYASEKFGKDDDTVVNMIKYGKEHIEVLKKFQRYPHRNKVLERHTTEEEKEWLGSDDVPSWARSQSSET